MKGGEGLFATGRQTRLGLAAILFLILGFGGWASLTRIDTAIIAPGQFEVPGNRLAIQHPTGGRLGQVLVSEGQAVRQGQTLAVIEAPTLTAQRSALKARLAELTARKLRLQAERDDRKDMATIAPDGAALGPLLTPLLQEQRQAFAARRLATESIVHQLEQRLSQVRDQIAGIDAQISAHQDQITLAKSEVTRQDQLVSRSLTAKNSLETANRDLFQLQGSLGELTANRAQAMGRAAEVQLEITRLWAERREDATEQLTALAPEIVDLASRLAALDQEIAALSLTSPKAGIVLGLRYSQPGAVLQPAEVLAHIVPSDMPLIVALRVAAPNAGSIQPGQATRLTFARPDLNLGQTWAGKVRAISPDAYRDPDTGQGFFRVEVTLDPAVLDQLRALGVTPGTPTEAFLVTDRQSPLTWMLHPLRRFFTHAFQ